MVLRSAPFLVTQPTSRPSASTTGAKLRRWSASWSWIDTIPAPSGTDTMSGFITFFSCVNLSYPAASCSVKMPTGRPSSSTTTTAPCARL